MANVCSEDWIPRTCRRIFRSPSDIQKNTGKEWLLEVRWELGTFSAVVRTARNSITCVRRCICKNLEGICECTNGQAKSPLVRKARKVCASAFKPQLWKGRSFDIYRLLPGWYQSTVPKSLRLLYVISQRAYQRQVFACRVAYRLHAFEMNS